MVALALVVALGGCVADEPEGAPEVGLPTPSRSEPADPGLGQNASIGPLTPVRVTVSDGADAGAAAGRSLNVPEGWQAEVWANVPNARLAAWTPDGRLLVSTGGRGAVAVLTPRGEGRAPEAATLLDGLRNPQGLAITQQDDRTALVVGEETRLVAYDYADGEASDPDVIIDGLPSAGHGAKAVVIQDETVYYSLGSSGNRDPADRRASPERAVVGRVDLDGSGNRSFATGVRNGFGLDFAPDGTLFAAVNQADNQPYPFEDETGRIGQVVPSYVKENPIEQVSRIVEGAELGWPFCVPDTRGVSDNLDIPFVNDPVLNPDGEALDCATLTPTMLGLPSHSAPLGLAFTHGSALPAEIGNGALLSAHGSWNRDPPRPPYVAYSAWNDATDSLEPPVELITGFQDESGSRWGRVVTAIPGPDGSIYVTDDEAGLVYRITPDFS
jgi:glucose/arabinose dehydrogenase